MRERRAFSRPACCVAIWSLCLCMMASTSGAVKPEAWVVSEQKDLLTGEMEGIRLLARKGFALGPVVRDAARFEDSFLWSLAEDGGGNLYVGTGSEGKVYRIAKDGTSELWADLDGDQVFAMAAGAKGELFAATSPEGKIYKISGKDRIEVYFEPEAKYVWSLLYDRTTRRLYAGTGEEGRIFVVTGPGQGEVFFDTGEVHVTALARERSGHILAGTVANAYVFRIDPKDKKGQVAYDSRLQEVRALATADDGTVYAAVAEGPSFAEVKEEEAVTITPGAEPPKKRQTGDAFFSAGAALRGELVALYDDGRSEQLYESEGDMIMGVAAGPPGRVFIITTDRVLSVHGRRRADVLFRSEDALITTLIGLREGKYAFCMSNEGAVRLMEPAHGKDGSYQSTVKDAKTPVRWGTITWDGTNPHLGDVQFFARTGNTAAPGAFWSEWLGPYVQKKGASLDLPMGRYCQWKVYLKSGSSSEGPVVESVALSYEAPNQPPIIDAVRIHPPGILFEGSEPEDGKDWADEPGWTIFEGSEDPKADGDKDLGKRKRRKGFRTVTWKAADPDGDRLQAEVSISPAGKEHWLLMKDWIKKDAFTWDTSVLPDGEYVVRVKVSDVLSNTPGAALTDEMTGDIFEIDNTPPQIRALKAEASTGGLSVRFAASDATGYIRYGEYSIDGRNWIAILPDDGIADQPDETFEFTVGDVEPGSRLLVVRVHDNSGNSDTRSVTVTVPDRAR